MRPWQTLMVVLTGSVVLTSALSAGALGGSLAAATVPAAAPEPQGAGETIFSEDSYVRAYLVYKTPVFAAKDGQVKPVMKVALARDGCFHALPESGAPQGETAFQLPPPPADWIKPEFDDSLWVRRRAPFEEEMIQSATDPFIAARNSLICLRAAFFVEDPAKVKDLRLSVEYVGGAAVYVNGQELARNDLPAGGLTPDTAANNYPDDLYVRPDGMFIDYYVYKKEPANAVNFARRYRKLADVAVPANFLRKGPNTVAVEIHRAPVNEGAMLAKRDRVRADFSRQGALGNWACAGLRSLRLTAAPGSGLTPNVARPKGVQVWNCAPWETIRSNDYGSVGEPLRPIAVAAAKNGVFSGRLVVSSDQAISGLKVAVSELVGEKGVNLPASAVRICCAQPAVGGKTWAPAARYDALAEPVPSEVPINNALPKALEYTIIMHRTGMWSSPELGSRQSTSLPEHFARTRRWTAGAMAPIWVLVRVPKDAAAGKYEGAITVSANGLAETKVPLRLTVYDWAMPDAKDFRTHTRGYVSLESEARYYGVPLWSDKHWDLVGKTLALMAEINSRQVLADLAIDYYGDGRQRGIGGNQESLVRWIKQPDGAFKHDFSVLDKYLDTVAKSIGKPLPLRLNFSEDLLPFRETGKRDSSGRDVTLLDPATGRLDRMEQPMPGTEASYQFWKPVLDEIRKKVEARGWFDVTAIGHNAYASGPDPEVVDVIKRIWPDGVWSLTNHGGMLGTVNGTDRKTVIMPVRYAEGVWCIPAPVTRGYAVSSKTYTALLDPKRLPGLWTAARRGDSDGTDLDQLRRAQETRIMQRCDGGQMGADYWPLRKRNGGYGCLDNSRGGLGPSWNGTQALLAPGPDGAIITERFEAFREGIQIAEAIMFLAKALQDKKIGGDLEQRVNRLLDERSEAIMGNCDPVDLFARDQGLLSLAGEAAKAMGEK